MVTRSVFDGYGLQIATYNDVVEDLETSFKASFGDNIRLQGSVFEQLIKIFSLTIAELNELIELVGNQSDPAGASGVALDRLVLLNGISRSPGSYSSAIVTLTASTATTVPAGTILEDDNNILWATDSDVVFTTAGTSTVGVTCMELGATALAAGTLKTIVNPVYGLTSVTNIDPCSDLGNLTETDSELRERRALVAERISSTSTSALYSAISDVDGVELVKILVNSGTVTDADGIPPQHIMCLIDGVSAGNEQLIGEAIFEHTAAGIGTAGDIDIDYEDSITGETYVVKYTEPEEIDVYIDVTLTVTDADVYSEADLIAAVQDYFTDNYTIGSMIYFTRNYQPIMSIPGHYVTDLRMGLGSSPSGTSNIQLGTIQMATPIVTVIS